MVVKLKSEKKEIKKKVKFILFYLIILKCYEK